MLSQRGWANGDQLDVPWRFLPRGVPYYTKNSPQGLVSFATAENALVAQELEEFASKVHVPADAFRYAFGTNPALPTAFAAYINELFGPYQPVSSDNIKLTCAGTALFSALALSLADPGEGILTSKPYYGRIEIDFWNEAGVHLVAAETDHETCFETDVVDAFEEALVNSEKEGVKIKALFIINPHNPLGRCYSRETLTAIMHFCQKHTIHLISDEIYAMSVWSNDRFPNALPFTSILSIDPSGIIDQNLLHVVYGLSKDFGSAGLKIGALISYNQQLLNAIQAVVRFHGVSGPSVAIATAMFTDREWCRGFLETARQRVKEAYEYAISRLNDLGIKYHEGNNAGFFIWVDLSPLLPPEADGVSDQEREFALAQKFLDGGVALQPGEEHGVRVGWFRIVFTMDRETMKEGFRRVQKVLNSLLW